MKFIYFLLLIVIINFGYSLQYTVEMFTAPWYLGLLLGPGVLGLCMVFMDFPQDNDGWKG